jgi:choline dehydrogenase-like flavoprotein
MMRAQWCLTRNNKGPIYEFKGVVGKSHSESHRTHIMEHRETLLPMPGKPRNQFIGSSAVYKNGKPTGLGGLGIATIGLVAAFGIAMVICVAIMITNQNGILSQNQALITALQAHRIFSGGKRDTTIMGEPNILGMIHEDGASLLGQVQSLSSGVAASNAASLAAARNRVKCGKTIITESDECVDFVIVGSGAAGSTMAGTLSANGTFSVLMLEAGPDIWGTAPRAQIADGANDGAGGSWGWGEVSEPQPHLGGATIGINAARLLGGGTAHNGIQYTRGTLAYWNGMEPASGSHGPWSGANVYAVMKQQEKLNVTNAYFTPGSTRGASGKWDVMPRPMGADPLGLFLKAKYLAAYSGVMGEVRDFNDGVSENGIIEKWQFSQFQRPSDGVFVRETTAQAWLDDTVMDQVTYLGVGGRRLAVRTQSTVTSLLFHPNDKKRCVGVQYVDGLTSETKTVYAAKSVILSAAHHNSVLLQLAGIGPTATLTAAGVPRRIVNNHVGRNYDNHPAVFQLWFAFGAPPDFLPAGEPAGTTQDSVGGIFSPDPSPSGSVNRRGFQWYTIPLGDASMFGLPPGQARAIFILPLHLEPKSRGTIDIKGPTWSHGAKINPNTLGHADDVTSHAMHWQDMVTRLSPQGVVDVNALFGSVNFTNINAVKAAVKASIIDTAHLAATCRVGTNANNGVVNWRARVFTTKGLRVCDTSILYKVPNSNTGVPAMAAGEICARMFIQDFGGDVEDETDAD